MLDKGRRAKAEWAAGFPDSAPQAHGQAGQVGKGGAWCTGGFTHPSREIGLGFLES